MPKLEAALAFSDKAFSNTSNDGSINSSGAPPKLNQIENALSIVESKLNELREELEAQFARCHSMLTTFKDSSLSSKPSASIASTIVTTMNEEKEKEKDNNLI